METPAVKPAKHVGIVAVSAEGAALCFRTLCVEGAVLMGRHSHPQISLHCHPLARYMEPVEAGDWHAVADLMVSSAGKLAAVGADFLICPDNTVHQAFDLALAGSSLPWLHIARVVAATAGAVGYGRVGVLGTRFLMEGPVYREALGAAGIEGLTPEESDRAIVDRIIFDELVHGRFETASRAELVRVIARLKRSGCEAVVLGCTEIPLLVSAADSPLPVLDSTRLLARAALREAVGLPGLPEPQP